MAKQPSRDWFGISIGSSPSRKRIPASLSWAAVSADYAGLEPAYHMQIQWYLKPHSIFAAFKRREETFISRLKAANIECGWVSSCPPIKTSIPKYRDRHVTCDNSYNSMNAVWIKFRVKFVVQWGLCALRHGIQISTKPFWLATQRDPQNDWTATQSRVNYDIFTQAQVWAFLSWFYAC